MGWVWTKKWHRDEYIHPTTEQRPQGAWQVNLPASGEMLDRTKISIVEYTPDWHYDFLRIAAEIRILTGSQPTRIDHIGSTSIPGLAAKDVIDIQISVSDLSRETVTSKLANAGYRKLDDAVDNLIGISSGDDNLQKRFLVGPDDERRSHIHVREEGRTNQAYPLLFRDFLRQDARMLQAYQTIKVELARHFPNDLEAYYAIKDPYMDTVYLAARDWANATHWKPDKNFR
jgi:GrpB-like predicted nucleotidyltransferase (UPF0157 family)